MNETLEAVNAGHVFQLLAGLFFGAGLVALLDPSPTTVPGVGSVPGVAVGALALVAGLVLYRRPWRSEASGCGCGSDCDC